MKYIVEFEDEPCMYEDEVHFYKCIQAPWWGLSEKVIKQLTPYQPDAPDTNVGNITNSCAHENDPISRQMALDAITDELMPSTPLSAVIRAKNRLKDLPTVQPDHVADISKKVEKEDCISRQAAIDALAKQMPRSYTLDGSHPGDEEIFKIQEIYVDCIESIEILPAAQPKPCEDAISRQAAIELCDWYDNPSLHDDLEKLPPAQPDHIADISKKVEAEDCISRQAALDAVFNNAEHPDKAYKAIRHLPPAQPSVSKSEMVGDAISRQAVIEAYGSWYVEEGTEEGFIGTVKQLLENMPSTQPTLCGYNIEHLILIAEVLRKENLPPERVVEALTDIGRIVSIVKDEFEESLRKAVEQCKV